MERLSHISLKKQIIGCVWGASTSLLLATAAVGADNDHQDHNHSMHNNNSEAGMVMVNTASPAMTMPDAKVSDQEADPHAHHRHMMHSNQYTRLEKNYALPDLALQSMDGNETSLLKELNQDKPVLVNFIYTTCTTICPVLSATFAAVQDQLGAEVGKVSMVSISIDPEYDTPERLRVYAERFNAGPQWRFLTGRLDNIISTQKAFDAYRGAKMNHEPLTFLRVAEGKPWVRLQGIASGADIVKEYQALLFP